MSDAIRVISENTAKMARGSYIKKRYLDIIQERNKPKTTQKQQTREQVINRMRMAIGKLQ